MVFWILSAVMARNSNMALSIVEPLATIPNSIQVASIVLWVAICKGSELCVSNTWGRGIFKVSGISKTPIPI